jgi:hypothetical protein
MDKLLYINVDKDINLIINILYDYFFICKYNNMYIVFLNIDNNKDRSELNNSLYKDEYYYRYAFNNIHKKVIYLNENGEINENYNKKEDIISFLYC